MHLTISFTDFTDLPYPFSVKSVQLMSEKRRIMNLFFKAPLFACLFFIAHLRVFLMIFLYVCKQTSNLHAYMELLVYKASAGSGKTFTLAVEYIKLLILNPRAYRQILAVTFTNKATAEMKERILTQLYGIWKEDPASDAYLETY